MADEPKVEAVIHGRNVGPEEEKQYGRDLTIEEIIQCLQNGSGGKRLLLRRREDTVPEDRNVVVEYVKKSG